MKTSTFRGGISLFILTVLTVFKMSAQTTVTGSASPNSVLTTALPATITLTGTVNNNRQLQNPTAWAGPGGGITVGSTTLSSGNNNSATATATIPAGTAVGTYTFTLSYTRTSGGGGGTSTGTVTTTVTVSAPPTPAVTITPSTSQAIITGSSVSFTATASNFTGSGNYTFTWTAAGATIPGSNPVSQSGTSSTKSITFPAAGTYTVSVNIVRGSTNLTTTSTTVNVYDAPAAANLWATSSDGTQISSFTVVNGAFASGPTNLFAASFPGTTTGGTSTAALGRNAQGGVANGYFYWLPNTSNNNGTVEVFAASANGSNPTRIGSVDVNGASTNSLGFVRLGMGPDGSGWILAGDGSTLYLAKFVSNGVNTVTFTIQTVTLSGGTASVFQNGDICISGNNNLYALANDGSGVTQLFTGSLSNPSVVLTKKLDLVTPANAAFTGRVNGVAFDVLGSLYISTDDGLYYINQATVNGPAGTVQCALVVSVTGLQDLASNVFPAQSTLPIKLGAFAAVKQGNNALVSWTTLSEINTDHFEIERSLDGINFSQVGYKAASGNSNSDMSYLFSDPISTSAKIIYYRLKTVDIDGKFSMSKTVALRIEGVVVKSFNVFPNPFTDNLKVQVNADKESVATIRITNLNGQIAVSRNVTLQPGENVIVLSQELATLSAGMHLMEISTTDGKYTQKIMKR